MKNYILFTNKDLLGLNDLKKDVTSHGKSITLMGIGLAVMASLCYVMFSQIDNLYVDNDNIKQELKVLKGD